MHNLDSGKVNARPAQHHCLKGCFTWTLHETLCHNAAHRFAIFSYSGVLVDGSVLRTAVHVVINLSCEYA